MHTDLSLALTLITAGLLLGVAVAAWRLRQQRRAAWALVEACSVPAAALSPGLPAARGRLEVGELVGGRIDLAVAQRGLLLWRGPGTVRLVEWSRIGRLLPLATRGGEIRGVTVELAGRDWGADRFNAPWSAALTTQVLEQGYARLAGKLRPTNPPDC
jgi:hypothetical protein